MSMINVVIVNLLTALTQEKMERKQANRQGRKEGRKEISLSLLCPVESCMRAITEQGTWGNAFELWLMHIVTNLCI